MQITADRIRNSGNAVSKTADHTSQTINDVGNDISAPIPRIRCKPFDIVYRIVKSTFNRGVNAADDTCNRGFHIIPDVRHCRMNGIHHRRDRGRNAVPDGRYSAFNSIDDA